MKYAKWLDKNIPNLEGKTIIVTGANSGIGFECSKTLIYKKANIIMACRNYERANKAKDEIIKDFPKANIMIEILDLSSFKSIESFVNNIKEYDIYALINNAGVYYPKKHSFTQDGLELTIGTNYFGTYYLSSLITKEHKEIDKIINVTSLTYRYSSLDINDLKCENVKNRNSLYAKSKLAIAAFTLAKQEESEINNSQTKYYLVHPGVSATNIISSKNGGFSKLFSKVGYIFLKMFCHSPRKACLSLLMPFKKEEYIGNYGPIFLQIRGYPKKIKNTKKQKLLKNEIILKTEEVIKSIKHEKI